MTNNAIFLFLIEWHFYFWINHFDPFPVFIKQITKFNVWDDYHRQVITAIAVFLEINHAMLGIRGLLKCFYNWIRGTTLLRSLGKITKFKKIIIDQRGAVSMKPIYHTKCKIKTIYLVARHYSRSQKNLFMCT